ncbi:hypothetical protein B9Z55_006990 [Caenorhabditis nigoni]|nr:hypothetical protein B9Z55_006990 [Caenorhabditis nigoni]
MFCTFKKQDSRSQCIAKRKKAERRKIPKNICRVCGAKAKKFSYGVILCNSCRNFFANYQEEFLKKCRELYLLDKTKPIVLDQDGRKIMMKIPCTYIMEIVI